MAENISYARNVPEKNTQNKPNFYNACVRNPKSAEDGARNAVAGRVRKARLAFVPPLTQDQLAGRIAAKGGVLDRVAITKIESGQRCVFDFELPLLADVLKIDVRWLLGMQEQGGPSTKERRAE